MLTGRVIFRPEGSRYKGLYVANDRGREDGKKETVQGRHVFAVSYLLMAIIPMAVCGIFFYPRTRNQIVERTNTSSMQQVERGLEELDRQLQIINNIPNVFFRTRKSTAQIWKLNRGKILLFLMKLRKQ